MHSRHGPHHFMTWIILVILVGCFSSQAARRAAQRLPLKPCRIEGVTEALLCGTYQVWEDREARQGRKIPLHVVVVPARGDAPAPDPIFIFAGGPGGAASARARWFVDEPLRERRDLVLVDQRGTGKSNPLRCDLGNGADSERGELRELFPVAAVEACRAELEKRADLTLYTSDIAMDDYDEIRRWLGYEKINLSGGSYGSKTVQVYMQRHPETVRAAFAHSILSLERSGLCDQARNAQDTLDALIAACAADIACATAFPRVREELAAVLAHLERQPVRVEVPDPTTGERLRMRLRRDGVAEGLRVSLYYLAFARAMPMAIHLAAEGDYLPITQLGLFFDRSFDPRISLGMLLTVYCSEDMPSFDHAQAIAEADETLFGSYRIRQQIQACEHWPARKVPATFYQPRRLEIPTLMISGGRDPANAPRYGEQAISHLPQGLHLVIPDAHHGTSGLENPECLWKLEREFLERGSVVGLDTSCVKTMRRQSFLTDRTELDRYLRELAAGL